MEDSFTKKLSEFDGFTNKKQVSVLYLVIIYLGGKIMSKYVVSSSLRNIGYQVGTQAGVHRFLIDEPVNLRGTDAGPNPVQYLLGAVNGCLAITAESVAKRQKLTLDKFDVRSVGNIARFEDGSSAVDHIKVTITFKADIEGQAKEDFLAETLKKCTVHKTLAPGVKFEFDFIQED